MKTHLVIFVCLCLLLAAGPVQAAPANHAALKPAAQTLAIPAAAFYPTTTGDGGLVYENHGRYLIARSPQGYFRAAVTLPHGAQVTRMNACFKDDAANAAGKVTLERAQVIASLNATQMAQVSSTNGAGFKLSSDTTINNSLIDLKVYSYWLTLELPVSKGAKQDVWGCGVYIEYLPPAKEAGILALPGAAFQPWVNGYNASYSQAGGSLAHYLGVNRNQANGGYMAPLNLPQGAVVKRMTLNYHDANKAKTITAWLQRGNGTGGYSNMANISSDDKSGSRQTTQIADSKIDNSANDYWLFLDMPAGKKTNTELIFVDSVVLEYGLPPAAQTQSAWLSLSNAGFTSFYDNQGFENHGRWLYHLYGKNQTQVNGVYVAPVYLPQGAKISSFQVAFYDAARTRDGGAYLVRTRLGENQILAQVSSSQDSGYHTPQDKSIDLAVVDNNQYAYFVYWDLPVSTSGQTPNKDDILGCRILINYTR